MKKQLKAVKAKIKENPIDAILVGAAAIGVAVVSVATVIMVVDAKNAWREQAETLDDAIDNGCTIWTNSDKSLWLTFTPESEITKY